MVIGRMVRVYEVMFGDGGTKFRRFLDANEADLFAAGTECFGRPAFVATKDVPRHIAQRWGVL